MNRILRSLAMPLVSLALLTVRAEAQAVPPDTANTTPGFEIIGHAGGGWVYFETGAYIARRTAGWEWTPLGASALFPSFRGGFVRLHTGINLISESAYAGTGIGISRFHYKLAYPFLRAGLHRHVGTQPVRLEARFELHDSESSKDKLLLFSVGIPLR